MAGFNCVYKSSEQQFFCLVSKKTSCFNVAPSPGVSGHVKEHLTLTRANVEIFLHNTRQKS